MIPKIVFIVPYRDREEHLKIFSEHMAKQMENSWKIYYIHQKDNKPFNRGAIKNIGFLIVKDLYPDDYKNITLVFNDIDSMAPEKLNFFTEKGKIKHFYGFKNTLGGIVSINAEDFEKLNGFPNLWTWGLEDNALQHRAIQHNMKIDRSNFYKIRDKKFIRLNESSIRLINDDEVKIYKNNIEGIKNISQLKYSQSENNFMDVVNFSTGREPNYEKFRNYSLKKTINKKMGMKFV